MENNTLDPVVRDMRQIILGLAVSNYKAMDAYVRNELSLHGTVDGDISWQLEEAYDITHLAAVENFLPANENIMDALPEDQWEKEIKKAYKKAGMYLEVCNVSKPVPQAHIKYETGDKKLSWNLIDTVLKTSVLLCKQTEKYQKYYRTHKLLPEKATETTLTGILKTDMINNAFVSALVYLRRKNGDVTREKTSEEDAIALLNDMGLKVL